MDVNDEILADPILKDKRMSVLDALLTKILRTSNKESRKKLSSFLKRWQARIFFVNALQEESDQVYKETD